MTIWPRKIQQIVEPQFVVEGQVFSSNEASARRPSA